jgi:transcription elongation factor GreA
MIGRGRHWLGQGREMFDELIEKLNKESEALLYELNVVLPQEIEKAVALGDLRENSEYHAALERQHYVRARLDHISRRLSEIGEIDIDVIPTDRVGFGSQVQLRNMDDESVESYTIALGDNIDFDSDQISMASPIGRALLGCVTGEQVVIDVPGGLLNYEILEFVTLHDLVDGDGG